MAHRERPGAGVPAGEVVGDLGDDLGGTGMPHILQLPDPAARVVVPHHAGEGHHGPRRPVGDQRGVLLDRKRLRAHARANHRRPRHARPVTVRPLVLRVAVLRVAVLRGAARRVAIVCQVTLRPVARYRTAR